MEPTNAEHPAFVPLNPMGAIPCLARLADGNGSVWWIPATANRWTPTHVLILWRTDPRNPRAERLVWLRTEDVRPWIHIPGGPVREPRHPTRGGQK